MPMSAVIARHAAGIDLYQYEVGTLFHYSDSREWCRDGQAEIIEAFDRRWLVDTYWRDVEHTLTTEQASSAKAAFVPSEHRKVSAGEAEVYGDDKVVRITRQHGSYTTLYVRADEPTLTELDHYRHLLRTEEERLTELEQGIRSSRRSIEHFRAYIQKLEATS